MYKNELKIQKALKNTIQVQFKNSEQKRIIISNTQTFVFSMFDADSQRRLIEKPLAVIDDGTTLALRGLAEVTLLESDTADLERGKYAYSIKALDANNSFIPTYVDTYYGASGTVYLDDSTDPRLLPSQEVSVFQSSLNHGTMLWEYQSRPINGNPAYKTGVALNTVAYYMTGFIGTVELQVTLDNSPDYLDNFSTIDTRVYTPDAPFTGIDYVNFNGIFSWINVKYIPALGPGDSDNSSNQNYRGTFDKVLYRS